MAPFLYCKKGEILDPKGGPSIQAAVRTGSVGGLMLTVPRGIELPLRTPVDIRLFDPILGVVRCRCVLSTPLVTKGMRTFRCAVLEQVAQLQRREDIKVSLSAGVDVTLDGRHYPATIQNISAGGVFLVSTMVAMTGDQLTFTFPLTETPISLTAEILRVELRVGQTSRSTYGYGCRFVDLGVFQESQLRSYVYQEERRLYRPE